jgi:uncharacterized protein (DUF362 family)
VKARVGVVQVARPQYPDESPYHPSEGYPEYPFQGSVSREPNLVYAGVRHLFLLLGFDLRHQGTSKWNPLGHIIEPGMTVIIKPNFVRSRHFEGKDPFGMITHPSVLRAVADYCWIALKGDGRIIIADAPQYDCNFGELRELTKLDAMCDFFSGFSGAKVEVLDLRNYWSAARHFPSMIRQLPGDPQGVVRVNLGSKSALYAHPHPERFYGAVYHRNEVISHHTGEKQEYEVSATVLNADVVISVPKMKVHKKVGVTLNTKGLVGICTNKNFLVHYTLGSPSEGGDQYPEGLFTPVERAFIKIERWMYDHLLATRKAALEYLHRSIYWLHGTFIKPLGITVAKEKRVLDTGNWYGNDSAWRMAVDLLGVISFSDSNGRLHDSPQRKLFSIVDGIIGGENNGPLVPDSKPVGILAGGDNLLAVDIVVARLMGFDHQKIRQFSVLNDSQFDFGLRGAEDIELVSNDETLRRCLGDKVNRYFSFKPHPGWDGHIEI